MSSLEVLGVHDVGTSPGAIGRTFGPFAFAQANANATASTWRRYAAHLMASGVTVRSKLCLVGHQFCLVRSCLRGGLREMRCDGICKQFDRRYHDEP